MLPKIILVLIMLSSIYSWEFASAALIVFAICSVLLRNKKINNYITEKNIGVHQRWDVKYLVGFPAVVVEKPTDCSLLIDDNHNLLVLIGEVEEKIPLTSINKVAVATKRTLGIGKMFKINYRNAQGEKTDVIFKSLNSSAIADAIMETKKQLSKKSPGADPGNTVIDVESL